MDQSAALIFSIGIEAATAAGLLRLLGWAAPWRGVAAAALATLVTHPVVWWSVPVLEPSTGYWPAVLAVEALVCLAESVVYRFLLPLAWPKALAVSVMANAASTIAGLLYYAGAR